MHREWNRLSGEGKWWLGSTILASDSKSYRWLWQPSWISDHSFIDKLVPFIPLNPWRKIFFRCNFQTGMRFTRDSTLEHLWPKYNSNVRIPRSNISISFSPLFSLFPFTLHDPLQILAWMNSKIWTKKKWNKVRND